MTEDRKLEANSPERALARDGFTTMVYILLGLAGLAQGALLIWTTLL